ncbi:MAG: CocE/NonD family hydrolase [Steroidobacteraceae bacterium]
MKPLLVLAILAFSQWAAAQDLEFHAPAAATDPAVPAVMRDLAVRILPVYQENDQDRYLRNLSALQMAARNFTAANESRQSLRDRRRNVDAHRPVGRGVILDMYARAKAREAEDRTAFSQTFTQSFWDVVSKLNDQDAYTLTGWLATPVAGFQDALQRSFDQWRSKGTIPLAEAIELISTYVAFDAYRSFHPLIAALDAENDSRRYVTDWDVLIETPDGESISAVLVRPKNDSNPLPTLLEFTIYVDAHNFARECAAHGYVGLVAFTRGERRSRGRVIPFRHDGDDARAVINWIAKQPWSDGRVGMYGTNYSAFTEWAVVAKHLPPALKAIATSSATAPGVDVPMAGNIVHTSAYRWSGCIGNAKGFDEKTCADDGRWRSLDENWYTSGKSFRELAQVFGVRNPVFHRWLDHPSYDRFWQKLVPFRTQFAHVNIPVLATTGYYGAGEPGTLYYFTQHYRYNPHANQTLLIGPYDDSAIQHGPAPNLLGLRVDPAALVDLRELRYEWFDHIFKGAAMPDLLKERVNYEVMGANEWRHAASLEAMGKAQLRFYLDAARTAEGHRLALRKGSDATFIQQTVNLADRGDANWTPPANLTGKTLQLHEGLAFVSEPLRHAQVFAGLFSGRLDFTVNKMDMDLNIALYELLPSGEYLQLFDPSYEFRASYARDRTQRHLLRAGERQQLTFRSERLTSRKLDVGSRVVVVLGVNKRPDRQVNYGTGAAVNEESIADGKVPLRIRWYSDSYLDIPVRR